MKLNVLFQSSLIILVSLVLSLTELSNGAKILSMNFMSPKSHKITYDLLLRELANRGHEVVVVTQSPPSNSTNPKEILTFDFMDTFEKLPDAFDMKIKGDENNLLTMLGVFEEHCRATYALPQMKELLNQKFDLVFHEPFFNECAAGFLYKLNTTVILITPLSMPPEIMRQMGGPAPPSFISNTYSPFDNKMNFVQRLKNFITEVTTAIIKDYYYLPRMEAVYRDALNDPTIPGVDEIIKNASLTLSNSHISLGGARPFMPDVIEVGGMHMRQAKPLPKDLEDFAQSSGEHGFIFFSMGSILQGSKLPEAQRKALLSAFSKLKQKVLWKWETESMPDLPLNVKLIKWAPQQDILGHPKIRAFITHGGLGSTTEAVYHGVPLIGIPMVGDQNMNMEKFVRSGIAAHLEFATLNEKNVLDAVNLVLGNEKYQENVKRMSRIFRDQRDNPLERAVFWIEYVLRHQGAVHLRSPSRDLNFLQYHSLDVIGTLSAFVILAMYILYWISKKTFQFCFAPESTFNTLRNKHLTKKRN